MDASSYRPGGVVRKGIRGASTIILAVSLMTGSYCGHFCNENFTPLPEAAAVVVTLLAFVQPSPLAMAAAGWLYGINLERAGTGIRNKIPDLAGREITVKGEVLQIMPGLHGKVSCLLRATAVMGREAVPADFRVNVSLPETRELIKGDEVLVRCFLQDSGYSKNKPGLSCRTTADGFSQIRVKRSSRAGARERVCRALGKFDDGPGAAMFAAVALGDRRHLDAGTRDVLRKTGTFHLIAISGVHVGAAILALVFLMRLAASFCQRTSPRVVRVVLLVLSSLTVGIYLYFTGISASALRASSYIFLSGIAAAIGRCSASMVSLSWCVIMIACFSPDRQPDVSLVLSALAVAGIVLSSRSKGSFLEQMMNMTLGAVLFTLPVAVWISGGISTIAPLGNAAAGIPFSMFLVPGAVLVDFASFFQWVPLEWIVGIWLRAARSVLTMMSALADLPLSYQRLSTTGCLAAAMAAIAGLLVWARSKFRPAAGVVVFASVLLLAELGHQAGERYFQNSIRIDFPPVGQADTAIIRHQGSTLLIDGGPSGMPGRDSPVVRALQRLGVRNIDAIFLSHPHPDHYGGVADVLSIYPVKTLYLPEQYGGIKNWWDGSDTIPHCTAVRFPEHGDMVEISSLKITVAGPDPRSGREIDINRRSMQLYVKSGTFEALFTGDAGWDQVQKILSRRENLDLLKIPHHGSKTGFPPAGLGTALERILQGNDLVAVCPSGTPGSRTLPAAEVVRWYAEKGINLVYTGDRGVNIRHIKEDSYGRGRTVVDNHNRF